MKSTSNNSKTPLEKSTIEFPVVGIGASAGGLEAFKKLVSAISIDSGMAYILLQHLSPDYESVLPQLLQKVTPVPVIALSKNISLTPNHIYVIASNQMLLAMTIYWK